jgi:hypothetical protein
LPHVLRENMSDGGQTRDIQLHHRQDRVERCVCKRALQSVAGVVDQNIDRNAALTETLLQANDCRNIGKIDLLYDDFRAVLLAECFSEVLQPVEPTSHQDQGMALFRVLTGELLAETARCARDENPAFVC